MDGCVGHLAIVPDCHSVFNQWPLELQLFSWLCICDVSDVGLHVSGRGGGGGGGRGEEIAFLPWSYSVGCDL